VDGLPTQPHDPAGAPGPEESPFDLAMPFAPDPAARARMIHREHKAPRRLWLALLFGFLIVALTVGVTGYFLYRIPVDQWGDAIRVGDHLEVYHGKGVSQEEAEALGRFLFDRGLGAPGSPATVRVTLRDGGYALYLFTSSPQALADPAALAGLRRLRDDASREVFDGRRVVVLVCNRLVAQGGMGALAEPEVLKVID
jgi:hypothetical protein